MADDASTDLQPTARRAFTPFVALLVALSVPIWIAGAHAHPLLPGLPLSALAAFCPGLAALLVVRRRGIKTLLARVGDLDRVRPRAWLVPILFLLPAVQMLAFAATALSGASLPAPHIALFPAVLMALVFLAGAVGEELGWTGYALEPLQARIGPLAAALVIGAVWAVWHIVPLLQVSRSVAWIAWWSIATVSTRVLMVWLYDRAGRSVAAVALFHASGNLAWQIAPNLAPFYDPRLNAIVLTGLALAVVGMGALKPSA